MIDPSLIGVLLASLTGSGHCVGMCGGFVALYSAEAERKPIAHLRYNGGRGLSYVLLGTAAGAAGVTLNLAGETLFGLQRIATIVTAVLLIAWGVRVLVRGRGSSSQPSAFHSLLEPVFRRVIRGRAWEWKPFFLGALSGLMPCGWLYAFVIVAAGSGSPTAGALIMAAFWLGTLPALVTLAGVVGLGSRPLLRFSSRLTAVVLIFAGAFSLYAHAALLTGPSGAGGAHDGHGAAVHKCH